MHLPSHQADQSVAARPRLNASLFAVGLAPIVAMLFTVISNWLPLPQWDEWHTPGLTFAEFSSGHLTLEHLFSQHNESRKFFPRLLYLALAQLGGWDPRKEMALIFLSVCATAALFFRLIRQLPGATPRLAILGWLAAAFLCFAPAQTDNFLWGIQVEVFFPGLALLAIALVNTSRLSLPRKALINGALALVATYTVAHGMLLWILGIPLLARGETLRKSWLPYGAHALCAVIASGGYFIGYHRPSYHPAFFAGGANIITLAHYLLLWVGSYFASPVCNAFIVGLAAVALFAGALLWVALITHRTGNWRRFYPPVLIAAYACMTAAITAAGRIGFGVEQALDARYRTYSLFFYLALVALICAIRSSLTKNAPRQKTLLGASAVIIAIAGAAAWSASYIDNVAHQRTLNSRNRTLLRALEWIEIIPDNPDLAQVFPYVDVLRNRCRILRAHRLLRLPCVGENIAEQIRSGGPAGDDETYGRLQSCEIDLNHNLRVAGKARLPNPKQQADCVVISYLDATGRWNPISTVETSRPRGKKKGSAMFRRSAKLMNLPPGDLTIAASAIDLRTSRVYPLAGAMHITVERLSPNSPAE